jgi:hypothetical protein
MAPGILGMSDASVWKMPRFLRSLFVFLLFTTNTHDGIRRGMFFYALKRRFDFWFACRRFTEY